MHRSLLFTKFLAFHRDAIQVETGFVMERFINMTQVWLIFFQFHKICWRDFSSRRYYYFTFFFCLIQRIYISVHRHVWTNIHTTILAIVLVHRHTTILVPTTIHNNTVWRISSHRNTLLESMVDLKLNPKPQI